MDLAMSELARIHLIAANEALMKGDTTAAFSQMNLAYLQFSMRITFSRFLCMGIHHSLS